MTKSIEEEIKDYIVKYICGTCDDTGQSNFKTNCKCPDVWKAEEELQALITTRERKIKEDIWKTLHRVEVEIVSKPKDICDDCANECIEIIKKEKEKILEHLEGKEVK